MKIHNISYLFMTLLFVGMVSAFTITAPIATTYNTTNVSFDVGHNETLNNITYTLDNSSEILACTNCSEYNTTLNLTEGNHTLTAFGFLENTTLNDSVDFRILLANLTVNDTNVTTNVTNTSTPRPFSIVINSPQSKTYYYNEILINVTANTTLDSLHAELGSSKNWTCTNCSGLNDLLNISEGNYTFKVWAVLDNVTKNLSVDFRVSEELKNVTENETHNNRTNESRFSTGFEKLPQNVAAGNITDAELADIIKNNKLNPGVLNRLIKTGKLGNESINAILDTQFQPQGIFKKLFGWMGFKNTYASKIASDYNLTEDVKEKIVKRDDLPKKAKEKINAEIGNSTGRVPPGQAKKIVSDDNNGNTNANIRNTDTENGNGRVPPGQAKKVANVGVPSEQTIKLTGNDKVPPGQAMKN